MALFDRFKNKPIRKIIGEAGKSGVGLQTVNWDKLGETVFDPEDIGVSMYKKMSKDATIRSSYNMVKLSILSRQWKIIHDEKQTDALEIVESLKYTFENMEGRLTGAMSHILSSVLYGFSVSEIIFDMFKKGKFKGKVGIKRIKGLDPETIEFKTTKKGELRKVVQHVSGVSNNKINLPIDRLIIHTHEKEFGNNYGVSRLRTVYEHWFIKRIITRFWNISLERFGTPIVIGTVPSKHDLESMKDILANLQSKSSIAKMDGWEIDALETGIGRSSGGDFKTAIDYHNSEILKGMLIPESLNGGGGSGGSFAKSKIDFELFQLMLRSLEQDICGIIENHIIKPLVFFNFGEQEAYPQFVFEPLTKAEFLELAKVFSLLVRNGVIGSEETWIRDMLRVPKYSEAAIDRDQVKASKGEGEKIPQPLERKEQKITQVTPDSKAGGSKETIKTPGKSAGPKKVKPVSKGPTQQIKEPKTTRSQSV